MSQGPMQRGPFDAGGGGERDTVSGGTAGGHGRETIYRSISIDTLFAGC